MFWFIHIMAAIFFIPALLLTIPLHIISNKLDKARAQPVESPSSYQEALAAQKAETQGGMTPEDKKSIFDGIVAILEIGVIIYIAINYKEIAEITTSILDKL